MAGTPKPVTLAQVVDLIGGAVRGIGTGLVAQLAKRDARIKAAEERLAAFNATLESLERRSSRHADHLGRLETRVKGLETK